MYPNQQFFTQHQENVKRAGKVCFIQGDEPIRYQEMITAVKKNEQIPIYTQETPRPNKKIALYDQEKNRKMFPLIRDKDVGMGSQFENMVIESVILK